MALRPNDPGAWLAGLLEPGRVAAVDGLVAVADFDKSSAEFPEVVAVMEAADRYEADAVFFEAASKGKPPVAQAFVYKADGPLDDSFGSLHKRLWSWGGVPLVYRVSPGMVHLFRCAHGPDFEGPDGPIAHAHSIWKTATDIAADPWWNAERLRNGTLWDDPAVCADLLSRDKAAQKSLIAAVWNLHEQLGSTLPKAIRRRLLILSVLIAYLEEREVLDKTFFKKFDSNADRFFDVLPNAQALLAMLDELENRFNGGVFSICPEEREVLMSTTRLAHFAKILDNKQSGHGQWRIWDRYSFADLPVELISHIYQLFVADSSVAVYTPHFVVRLMVGEALSMERMDRLQAKDEVILDGACGSGVFLVEAYKRLILHWRARNGWQIPSADVLKQILVKRIRGVDIEPGAVELAAFSLCLAICDALDKDVLKKSRKLFPMLVDGTVEASCFFKAVEEGKISGKVGVVLGNPPFISALPTEGAKRAYKAYQLKHGKLPDTQLAYLFLHVSMELLAEGGILSMVQQYNFLYNEKPLTFRKNFIRRWDVREILDFVSIRGLFQKGDADTKAVVVVAEAQDPKPGRSILHATFRRSGRADAEVGFDIDHYDLHWISHNTALEHDAIWRSNLHGGGRVLGFVQRMNEFKRLGEYARERKWDFGEGFIAGKTGKRVRAPHITGKPVLTPEYLKDPLPLTHLEVVEERLFKTPYDEQRFEAPMVLIHEHEDLSFRHISRGYYTYRHKIAGFCVGDGTARSIVEFAQWLSREHRTLQALVCTGGTTMYTQRASSVGLTDLKNMPSPEKPLDLNRHEQIIVDDLLDYYRDLIRLGEKSKAMKELGVPALPAFNAVYTTRINGIYKKNQLRALDAQTWSGVVCQPFVFGKGSVDWRNADELKDKLDALLKDERSSGLNVTRIVRLYDGPFIFLLKPDRLRYWLKSIALRDADDTLVDMIQQGF
jgi:N-6 DNA Methylase